MMEVSIYATQLDYSNKHAALRKRLDNSNFAIPYDSIITSAHCLFGETCVIEFVVL